MSTSRRKNANWQDMLRLSASSYENLLSQLDNTAEEFIDPDQRRADRHPFPKSQGLPLKLIHAEGEPSWFIVRPRNLSESGIGVLHGGFVHPHTRCVIALRRLDGPPVTLEGQTVRCRHVAGCIHEIGIQFDQPIDLAGYLPIESDCDDEEDGEASRREAG